MFLIDRDCSTSAWITARASLTVLYGEGTKPAEFDAVAFGHRFDDFIEHSGDKSLYIALIKMGIFVRDLLYKFRPDHEVWPPLFVPIAKHLLRFIAQEMGLLLLRQYASKSQYLEVRAGPDERVIR